MHHELARPELSFKNSSIELEQTEINRFVKSALSRAGIKSQLLLEDNAYFYPLIQDICDLYASLTFESINGNAEAKKFLQDVGIYRSTSKQVTTIITDVIHTHYFPNTLDASLMIRRLYSIKNNDDESLFLSQESLVRFMLEFIIEILDYLIADQKAIKIKSFTSDFKAVLAKYAA